MPNKVLVLGASGMLGNSLFRYFSEKAEYTTLGTVRKDAALKLVNEQGFNNITSGIDITNINSIENVICDFKPDVVFNCIGVIKQLDAAKNNIQSISINSLLPHQLAELCTLHSAKLIHFSTDCVFTGSRGGYVESDFADAPDLYGRSKLLGEVTYDGHLTLRTSIIGHEISSHHSLVDWFLNQENEVDGYSSAIFSGLPTCYMAEVLDKFILPNKELSGLRHLSVSPINKYDLLTIVRNIYGKETIINKSSKLIIDRSLNSEQICHETGFVADNWLNLIKRMNNEYNRYFTK